MFWNKVLVDTPNGSLFFGYLSETGAVLLFGILLVALTIGVRWFLKRYEEPQNKTKEVVKR